MGQKLCWMRSGHRLWHGYIKGGTVELFNADSSRVGVREGRDDRGNAGLSSARKGVTEGGQIYDLPILRSYDPTGIQ